MENSVFELEYKVKRYLQLKVMEKFQLAIKDKFKLNSREKSFFVFVFDLLICKFLLNIFEKPDFIVLVSLSNFDCVKLLLIISFFFSTIFSSFTI